MSSGQVQELRGALAVSQREDPEVAYWCRLLGPSPTPVPGHGAFAADLAGSPVGKSTRKDKGRALLELPRFRLQEDAVLERQVFLPVGRVPNALTLGGAGRSRRVTCPWAWASAVVGDPFRMLRPVRPPQDLRPASFYGGAQS